MTNKKIDDTEKMLLEAMEKQNQEAEPAEQVDLDDLKDLKKDYIAHAGKELESGVEHAAKDDIIKALKTVEDPEIMINIYDLGLIYDIRQNEKGDVDIDMTVTTPMCPVAGILPQQAADAVAMVKGVGKVMVKIVWEPAWSIEFLSDDAKMMIEMF